jgi:hypothetical protein
VGQLTKSYVDAVRAAVEEPVLPEDVAVVDGAQEAVSERPVEPAILRASGAAVGETAALVADAV